jgi:hypothetical protein
MSLQHDLDSLMWPVMLKFNKSMNLNEWWDFTDWCNDTFGMNGWFLDGHNRMYLRKEEYATIFVLRWS